MLRLGRIGLEITMCFVINMHEGDYKLKSERNFLFLVTFTPSVKCFGTVDTNMALPIKNYKCTIFKIWLVYPEVTESIGAHRHSYTSTQY